MRAGTLPVAELFGPTWQGEGRYAGQHCGFLRLGLCNLRCEWCDTPYTWDHSRFNVKEECPPRTVPELVRDICTLGTPLMVLTGGEPLIHARPSGLCLLAQVMHAPVRWLVETNGTLEPPPWLVERVEHFTVSPKINTRDKEHARLRPRALEAWTEQASIGRADFKFVVRTEHDLDVVNELVFTYAIPRNRVWVMPEGTNPKALLATHRLLADAILERGYHTTTRLQTLLWADERGH